MVGMVVQSQRIKNINYVYLSDYKFELVFKRG